MKPKSNATSILNRRHPTTAQDLAQRAAFRQAFDVAEMIYKARTDAGLTQHQLAKRVGTTTSVISRLESADYEGHSMAMLRRIAQALGHRVELRFVPAKRAMSA